MLRINRQTDYAIRIVLALAKTPAGTRLSSSHIQKEMLIPKAYMARIVAQLAKTDFITAYPGRDGGLQLAKPANDVTLRDVVELMEQPLYLSECMLDEQACPFEGACPVRKRWHRLQNVIMNELEQTNFEELAQEGTTIQSIHQLFT
jgi:Rrf2 family protein